VSQTDYTPQQLAWAAELHRCRTDFAFAANHYLSIKTKQTIGLSPLKFNRVQARLWAAMADQLRRTGQIRQIWGKSRQVGSCLDPDTPVLTADLHWIPLGKVTVGDRVIAVDEMPQVVGRGHGRKFRTAIVEAVNEVYEPAFLLRLQNGRTLIATGEHRFLVRKGFLQHHSGSRWQAVKDFTPGKTRIRYAIQPWEESATFEDGWMGGILDGKALSGCGYDDAQSWSVVDEIIPLGHRRMIDIQTSTGTFIANGFVSHNSTLSRAFSFWNCAFRPNRNAILIAHDEPSSYELFTIDKLMYEQLPKALKPKTSFDSKFKLEFPALNSKIVVGHARNMNVGASQMSHIAHLTEVARYPNPDEVQASLFPAFSDARGQQDYSAIILESTSHFNGAWFKEFAEQAQRGENGFEFHFVPWFEHEDYTLPVPDTFAHTLTMDERDLMRRYRLTLGQIAWRRQKRATYVNPVLFEQEYPLDWESSWRLPMGTHRVFGDLELAWIEDTIAPGERYMPTARGLEDTFGGLLEVWQPPKPGIFYHLGCLPDGEHVWTSHGLKAIEKVTLEDTLLTADGQYEHPVNTQRRWFEGLLHTIQLQGMSAPVRLTGEHPVLVTQVGITQTRYSTTDRRCVRPSAVEWKRAAQLTTADIVRFPASFGPALSARTLRAKLPAQTHIRIDRRIDSAIMTDPELWFLLGLWLAEGYVAKQAVRGGFSYNLIFALNKTTDVDVIPRLERAVQRLLKRKLTVSHRERSAVTYQMACQPLYEAIIHWFGQGAANKTFPAWMLQAPDALKWALFEGYWRGDGCLIHDRRGGNPILNCVSISRSLLDMMQALLQSLNVYATVNRLRPAGVVHFPGKAKPSSTRETWSLCVRGDGALLALQALGRPVAHYAKVGRQLGAGWIADGYVYTRIRSITAQPVACWVNNFETPSHTYTANRMTVHNCDVAQGRDTQADWTVLTVLRGDTFEQVAEARFKWDPADREFHDFVYWTGLAYNTASIIPDITGGWGHALLSELQRRSYSNLWQWRRRDDLTEKVSKRVGFVFTKRDKMALINNGVTLIRQKKATVRSLTLLNEMRTFIQVMDEYMAAPGTKDDAVCAWLLAALSAVDATVGLMDIPEEPAIIRPDGRPWAQHDIDADLHDIGQQPGWLRAW